MAREMNLRSVLGLAYSDLATSNALTGDYGKALNYYEQANQWDPSVPGLDKNLGQSAFRAGNYPEAISALSKALVQTPSSAPIRAKSMCNADRGLRGAGDSLFHNNEDGTFTDVSKAAGVSDPTGYYGLGVVWADFNNTGKPDIYIANDSTPKYLHKKSRKWEI